MKVLVTLLLGIGLFALIGCATEKTVLKDEKEKLSYSIGVNVGKSLKMQATDINPDILSKGVKDAYSESELLITEEEVTAILAAYQQEMLSKRADLAHQLAEKNKIAGDEFLAENAKKEGVVTLPSGLQYKVIEEGTGKTPTLSDRVVTQYRGMLIDGTEFDSSYKRGEPATFPMNGVIKGWTEALHLMKEGGKWQLFIPPDLAYGVRGSGSSIEPNATLIFEIELISVEQGSDPHQ